MNFKLQKNLRLITNSTRSMRIRQLHPKAYMLINLKERCYKIIQMQSMIENHSTMDLLPF